MRKATVAEARIHASKIATAVGQRGVEPGASVQVLPSSQADDATLAGTAEQRRAVNVAGVDY